MPEINPPPSRSEKKINRTVKIVLIIAVCVLVLRGLLFLIEDGYNMTPEEGAKLKPVETHTPEH